MPKKKFIKERAIKTTKRNYSKVEKIVTMRPENLDGVVIKFYNYDGSHKIVPCNTEFFFGNNGKKLDSKTILNKIYDMKHDYGAKYFKIL